MKQTRVNIINDEGKEVEALAPMILSASRATDIPAFYSDWFFKRLDKGYCKWRNPFNGIESYISFQNVKFIVFWSKNPTPLIPYMERLRERGIGCYIQYTLNDYCSERLEPGVPPLDNRIRTFKNLTEILGVGGVVWRFDPLVLTDTLGIDELLHRIERIGDQLKGFTEKLIFSFADISSYRKVGANLQRYGLKYYEWSEAEMVEFAKKLSTLNVQKKWNLQLATCGEKIDLEEFDIKHNRCIDDELITRISWHDNVLMDHIGMMVKPIANNLFGEAIVPKDAVSINEGLYAIRTRSNRDGGQRKLCGCIAAKDIGQYNTCPHGCVYCYANISPESARARYRSHLSDAETIII